MSTYEPGMAERFQKVLQQREHELRQALVGLAAHASTSTVHEVSDFKDVALRSADAALDGQHAQRIEHSLAQVLAARRRLEGGHFGLCQQCEQPIDLRRLQALPEAELCTACQSAQEAVAH